METVLIVTAQKVNDIVTESSIVLDKIAYSNEAKSNSNCTHSTNLFCNAWKSLQKALFEKVLLTVEEEKRKLRETTKLEEKVIKLRSEQKTLQKNVETQRLHNLKELKQYHNLATELTNDIQIMDEKTEAAKNQTNGDSNVFIKTAETKHEKQMRDRLDYIIKLELKLHEKEHKNKAEVYAKKKIVDEMQSDALSCNETFKNILKERVEETKQTIEIMKIERDEIIKLQDHFNLIDLNKTVWDEEELILEKVKKTEAVANLALNDGAIHLQKLFRGKHARLFVSKLKKKRFKQRKKQSKKKKINKNK